MSALGRKRYNTTFGWSHGNLHNNSRLSGGMDISGPGQFDQCVVLVGFPKVGFFIIEFGGVSMNVNKSRFKASLTWTILGTRSMRKAVKMRFTVVNATTSYNVIFGQLMLNQLLAIVSTTQLCMKYPVDNLVRVICANQHIARRCYDESTHVLESKQKKHIVLDEQMRVHPLELDPQFDREDTKLQPDEDLKEIQVGLKPHQRMKIGASLDPSVEEEVV
ncbi:hypothetical protein CR513_30495, partial [Mucuna pruriens]